ncbi:MAG: peptide chain release factor-like protein [Alphaproteobacteria bacterium]|nr:peptide chain release factor-like protein [Alphaproteobacteria bacterium]
MSVELLVTSGDGPLEVRWFVAALVEALAERFAVLDRTVTGPEDAPYSVVLQVADERVGDWLGTHALYRPSERRRGRSRWYVGVSALPPVPSAPEVDPADVEVRTMRGGGPGGQAVNTTASAVVAVHRPSGVSVRIQDERSQHQNRRRALERLAVALARRAEAASGVVERSRWLRRHQVVRGDPVRRWRDDRGRLVEER